MESKQRDTIYYPYKYGEDPELKRMFPDIQKRKKNYWFDFIKKQKNKNGDIKCDP